MAELIVDAALLLVDWLVEVVAELLVEPLVHLPYHVNW